VNLQLPSERDLPEQVLRQIEAELVATVEDGNDTAGWRWPAPVAAAATVLVTLGVVVGVVHGSGPDRAKPAASASSRSAQQGLPAGVADRIVSGCAKAYGNGIPGPVALADAKLYNLNGTPSKGVALIYSDKAVLVCLIGGGAMPYNPGGGGILARNLVTPPYQVDYQSESGSGRVGQLTTHLLIGGRVTPEVTRMTLTVAGKTTEIPVRDHTFVADIKYSGSGAKTILRAYDAHGKLLAEPAPQICLTTPDGRRLGDAPPAGKTCAPTVAWP
jgi:hypothetical protein